MTTNLVCKCTWCNKSIHKGNSVNTKSVHDALNQLHWFHIDCYAEYKSWYCGKKHKDIG